MDKVLRRTATVLPGGKVEIATPELEPGQLVEVEVRCEERTERRSAADILAEAPGHLLFKTAEEVREYLAEEKASWKC